MKFHSDAHDQEHHTRYVLCAPDGTEREIEWEEAFCWGFAIGHGAPETVRIETVRLDSIPQVWPKGGV